MVFKGSVCEVVDWINLAYDGRLSDDTELFFCMKSERFLD